MRKALYYLFVFGVFVGFADALYLALTHYLGLSPVCGPLHGCQEVAESAYSNLFGIHLSYIGVAYYALAAMFSGLYLQSQRARLFLFLYSAVGAVMSVWFIYIQGALIHAWCIYCLISAGASFMLFTNALAALVRRPKVAENFEANKNN